MTLAARLDPYLKRYSFEEFHRLIESGHVEESNQLELIDGILVKRMGKNEKHTACERKLLRLLMRAIGDRATLQSQCPIRIPPNHQPEPDFAIVHSRFDDYLSGHPQPKDIYLVIEVADFSLPYDQGVKLELYAKAGIPHYWIFNLQDNQLEAYSQPQTSGSYEQSEILTQDSIILIPGIPGAELNLAQVFSIFLDYR